MKKLMTSVFAMLLLALGTVGAAEHGEKENAGDKKVAGSVAIPKGTSEASLPDYAVVGLAAALDKALKAVPGKPLAIEMENDDGFLVYEVKIVRPDKTIMEVTIDAGTGSILETEED